MCSSLHHFICRFAIIQFVLAEYSSFSRLPSALTLSFAIIVAVFLILGSNNINNNGDTAKMKDSFERDDVPMLVDAAQPPGSLTHGTHHSAI